MVYDQDYIDVFRGTSMMEGEWKLDKVYIHEASSLHLQVHSCCGEASEPEIVIRSYDGDCDLYSLELQSLVQPNFARPFFFLSSFI